MDCFRSRCSACLAEAYPPLRPLVVYPHDQVGATGGKKNSLIFAALSDMLLNGQLPESDLATAWLLIDCAASGCMFSKNGEGKNPKRSFETGFVKARLL
jgi:hypothetical protein